MNNITEMMNLTNGVRLVCENESSGVNCDETYIFDRYWDYNVPKNNYNATMTWYPDRVIWTPEQYEEIRFNFMMIYLHGIPNPVFLKDFKIKA